MTQLVEHSRNCKSKVVIVHGAYGYPTENWFGWLHGELNKLHVPCVVPQLPTPENQSLESWLRVFNHETLGFIDSYTILIGHSLGAAFLLRFLERIGEPVHGVFLVGAFRGMVGLSQFDGINASFFQLRFQWKTVRERASFFKVYHGSNDPYVPLSDARYIAYNLKAKFNIVPSGGHLNKAAGYISFEQLLEDLKTVFI